MDNIQTAGYTASDAFNDALVRAGVTHVFLNSGTDYPPLIESWAKFDAQGRQKPEIIISPHETAALSAAQGYAQLTGKPQAVFVHVDVGTQNLGGTIHNAFRCRVPVLVFAGLSPYTIEGELAGGRNTYIQFIQDAGDQSGIVRGYTKLNFELRTGKNVQQMIYRSLQLAKSEPQGPVYLMATREVLEEDGVDIGADMGKWSPVAPSGLDANSVAAVARALAEAKNPLIITSYLGRSEGSVGELVRLAERLAIPVVESYRANMNFPASNPLHLGYDSRIALGDADVVLVIDSDMPWIPAQAKPKDGCRVFVIDTDPIKDDIPVWYIEAERFMRADSYTALQQLNLELDSNPPVLDMVLLASRREKAAALHAGLTANINTEPTGGNITPGYLSMCLREVIDDDTVLLNEAITNQITADLLLPRNKPGTYFFSGGSSLGWHGGAAVGMKLARPELDIVALTGDGTYIFTCPTAVFWMARKYNTPFMTVIFNNQAWTAPKLITLNEHPQGCAKDSGLFWNSLQPPARLDMVANAAGGAFAKTVSDPAELKQALREGKDAVKNGVCAVINVILPPV